jgi:hypothetical protein
MLAFMHLQTQAFFSPPCPPQGLRDVRHPTTLTPRKVHLDQSPYHGRLSPVIALDDG